MDMSSMEFDRPQHPRTQASLFSKWSFWWLRDLFKLGLERPIEQKDIYQTLPEHGSARLLEVFSTEWQKEKQTKRPSLFNIIFRVYVKKIFLLSIFFSLLDTTIRSIQPLCLGGLVMYFSQLPTPENGSQSTIALISKAHAYWYAGGILTCAFISMLVNTSFVLYTIQMGLRIHLTCRSMVYKKTLKMTKSVAADGLNGRVINLMSTDVAHFDYSMYFVHLLWKGPIELAIFGYLIYLEIGFYGWIGLGFILCFVPMQLWMGKMAATYRLRTAKRTDKRVKIMNEIIQGIQVIKMYAWEMSFAKLVDTIRKKELKAVRGSHFIKGILISFNMVSRVSIFLSLASYVYCGNVFTAKQVFIVTSYFNFLYNSMLHSWPMALTSMAECYVSIKRIQAYLLEPESKFSGRPDDANDQERTALLKKSSRNNLEIVDNFNASIKTIGSTVDRQLVDQRRIQLNNVHDKRGLVFEGVTALWPGHDDRRSMGIKNVSLHMDSLTAIIGTVGAGKSTLLQTILGELEIDEGQLRINGSISYAAQEPWLFEANVRQNILFNELYDEKRYTEVVRVCALERDFEILPYGDYTIVGERGISLSGGQRARINLARAIYRQADIYLLDDPLSAVDTHVGKHIFEQCIRGFLRQKVCILVTHQLQYLSDVSDIVLLNAGSVAIHGNMNQLKNSDYKEFLWMAGDGNATEQQTTPSIVDEAVTMTAEVKEKQRITHEKQSIAQEEQILGAIGYNVFKVYFASVESRCLIICTLAILVIEQIATSFIDLFVAKWVTWESSIDSSRTLEGVSHQTLANDWSTIQQPLLNVSNQVSADIDRERSRYVFIYTGIMCLVLWLVMQRGISFFYMCLRASRRLHDRLFRGIIHATMSFFNTNSSGRIINRFSKDIAGIDTALPLCLYESMFFTLQALGNMILVSVTNHWLLLPTCVLLIVFCALRQIYIQTGRCVKRVESLSRSPLYSHTNGTISGLATIRACNAEQILMDEFNAHQDVNVSAGYLFYASSRALSFWLEAACFAYMITAIITFFIFDSYSIGGNVGLAITQILYLTTLSQWGMRQTTELENQMTFVERVAEYTQLKPESPLETEPKNNPGNDWPVTGDIEFENLTLRYAEKGKEILNGLNISIRPQQKIGIVGRTGAGKSSIIQALFRLAHNEGTIKVNGVDISTLGLHELRKKISIIPQDPILFSGTMRDNLDPFETASDDDLWSALERVELKSTVSLLPGGLDCKMSDGGSNFSMGQRQLVCLARAILRNNKILILDEATANVDADTDKFIQTTISDKFAHCTVLTIAHRLHTVMDSDKVLVMDAGRIVEYDHPYNLLQTSDGFLRKLVNETESAAASQLFEIAKQSFKEKCE